MHTLSCAVTMHVTGQTLLAKVSQMIFTIYFLVNSSLTTLYFAHRLESRVLVRGISILAVIVQNEHFILKRTWKN